MDIMNHKDLLDAIGTIKKHPKGVLLRFKLFEFKRSGVELIVDTFFSD